MGAFFKEGEEKIRPGVYKRYVNGDAESVAGASDGICALPIQADWGPVGTVTAHKSIKSLKETYGKKGTTTAACRVFEGGADTVYIYRLGSGGTCGEMELEDETADVAVKVVTLKQKYAGARKLTVTIRELLGDTDKKECIVYDGADKLETITFEAGENEPEALANAVNKLSIYMSAEKKNDGNGKVKAVAQKEFQAGTNPSITAESYGNAFAALEPYKFNVLAVDTDDTAVHLLAHEFIKRIYDSGSMATLTVGEPVSVSMAERLAHAAAFNDEKVQYVGGAYKEEDGHVVEGFEAAALVAGIIASTPSNESIVHYVLENAVGCGEMLTNEQYENAILNGMLTFSEDGSGNIWIDSGVNTLVSLSSAQDLGWKKIKRTKVRFELFDRLNRTIAPVIGKINCDNDGIANVIKLAQEVIDTMIAEKKLASGGSITEDTDLSHQGDSAWFNIDVDDVDSLEKIYLKYQFRFSAN